MPISDGEIRELEDVRNRTTTGMWELIAHQNVYIEAVHSNQHTSVAQVNRLVDGDFIAAAHRAVPLMIAEIRTLRAELQMERERPLINRILDRLQFWKG
jgi:hypothetical protein